MPNLDFKVIQGNSLVETYKGINFGSKIYGFKRISKDKKQTITCVTNLSSVTQKIKINRNNQKMRNLMGAKIQIINKQLNVS